MAEGEGLHTKVLTDKGVTSFIFYQMAYVHFNGTFKAQDKEVTQMVAFSGSDLGVCIWVQGQQWGQEMTLGIISYIQTPLPAS